MRKYFKCYTCGEVFENCDADSRTENVGEFWGTPAYETYPVCPYCGSDELDDDFDADELDDEGDWL